MKRQAVQTNGETGFAKTMENTVMHKIVVVSVAAVAALVIFGFAIGNGSVAFGSPLTEPSGAPTAAEIIRTYTLPGDEHDAVASFGELFREEAVSRVSAVLRIYPMPGDPHDFKFSYEELTGQSANVKVAPVATTVVPMPGDPHDAAVQLAEWYESLQPEPASRIRLSD